MKKLQFIICLICVLFIACEDDFSNTPPIIPSDNYVGDMKTFELGVEAKNFHFNDTSVCYMLAPENTQISR